MKVQKERSAALRWEVGIPALIVGGIVFVLYITDDSVTREPFDGWIYVILLLVLLLGLTALMIVAVYGNRSYAVFEIDEKGIRQYPTKKTHRKNTAINTILFLLGLASGRPGYAGAALIAQSTNSASITWRNVGKLKFYPRQKAIAVKNSWRTVLVIYCTPENYEEVSQFMYSKFNSINKLLLS